MLGLLRLTSSFQDRHSPFPQRRLREHGQTVRPGLEVWVEEYHVRNHRAARWGQATYQQVVPAFTSAFAQRLK